MYLVILLIGVILFFIYQIFNESGNINPWPEGDNNIPLELVTETNFNKESAAFWQPSSIESLKGSALEAQILYGKDLIAHTAKYLGPKGSVAVISNGMNCQNCHLEAGTKIFGNNYGSVAATFPKFRDRSGSVESVYKRVNDCIERSLNGTALDTASAEMQAIKAYFIFLGKNVEKGTKVKGSGFRDLPFPEHAADPAEGKIVYAAKCASCHMLNGEGIMAASKDEYTYPPLWGRNSFNDAAGLYRISNFAKYIKTNMPLGATHLSTQLTDNEAWNIAAFVNSQPRPHKQTPFDWPDISKKPLDHPFGPYHDGFTERQHKYGPFKPIAEARKRISENKK
ncbi:MAG: c-type cytochrome [Saprospiraceae bacterium]|nr:c-type cytochrome [Saprospiraceae bacterium]